MVGCELGGKGADGRRSDHDLREGTRTSETARDIKAKQAKAFRYVSVLRG